MSFFPVREPERHIASPYPMAGVRARSHRAAPSVPGYVSLSLSYRAKLRDEAVGCQSPVNRLPIMNNLLALHLRKVPS